MDGRDNPSLTSADELATHYAAPMERAVS